MSLRLFQIRQVIYGNILFETMAETFKDALQQACNAGVDLSHVNCEGQNLTGLVARGINFKRAWMKNAILNNAKFIGCNLDEAKLSGVTAQRSIFQKTTMEDATGEDGDFTDSTFSESTVTGIYLGGAVLSDVARDHLSDGSIPDEA